MAPSPLWTLGVLALAGCLAGQGPQTTAAPGQASCDQPPPSSTSLSLLCRERFLPENVATPSGAPFTWRNLDGVTHSVVVYYAENGTHLFQDPDVAPGEAVLFSFEADGLYLVYCRFHSNGLADLSSGMVQRVKVV